MLNAFPYILAEDDVNWPKVLFGIIFVIIWAISALVSWINKQQQEAKRRRVREELERSAQLQRAPMTQRAPPPPPRQPQRIAEGLAQRFPDVLLPPSPPPVPPQQRRPMPMPQQRMPIPQQRMPAPPKPVRRTPKQPQVRRPAPMPPPPLEEVTPPTAVLAQQARAVQPLRATKPPVDAAALAKWLQPATLRQQFMLTEILQPPLALRRDSDHR